MKQPYNIFVSYLPYKTSIRYPRNPILYIYEYYSESICAVYSFDKLKEVLYVSDYNQKRYRYMSLYEFKYNGWEILTNDRLHIILNQKEKEIDVLSF